MCGLARFEGSDGLLLILNSLEGAALTWVEHLACTQPKNLGYAAELWTRRTLAEHIRKVAESSGHPGLDILIVDEKMIPLLNSEWTVIAFAVMRRPEIFAHQRATFSLRKLHPQTRPTCAGVHSAVMCYAGRGACDRHGIKLALSIPMAS